jgi:hypothetical protein
MTGLLIATLALHVHALVQAGLFAGVMRATRQDIAQVNIGWPAIVRFAWRGVAFRLGPLPFGNIVPRATETRVAIGRSGVWTDAEAQKLAQEQTPRVERRPLALRLARVLGVLLSFALGAAFCGDSGPPPVGSFLVAVVTQPWLPWTRGASSLREALDLLSALPLTSAIGTVLMCWAALIAVEALLEWLMSLSKGYGASMACGLGLALLVLVWGLALPFALFFC